MQAKFTLDTVNLLGKTTLVIRMCSKIEVWFKKEGKKKRYYTTQESTNIHLYILDNGTR